MATTNAWKGDYDRLTISEFIPANYKVGHLMALLNGRNRWRITFAISPSNLNESRANEYQTSKTNGGYFAMKMGPSPTQISWSGYMLDIEGYLEKHKFLENWKNLIEDRQNSNLEYENEYTFKFVCMGREYYGIINSINIGTDARTPLLHSYSISMTCFNDKCIYTSDKVITLKSVNKVAGSSDVVISNRIYGMLNR